MTEEIDKEYRLADEILLEQAESIGLTCKTWSDSQRMSGGTAAILLSGPRRSHHRTPLAILSGVTPERFADILQCNNNNNGELPCTSGVVSPFSPGPQSSRSKVLLTR